MKKMMNGLILAFLLLATLLRAQDERALFNQISVEEQKSIDALVMYPEDTRMAILEVAQQPALLVKMNKLQDQSSVSFRDLIADYSRDKQEAIWDLTRYPELIPRLITTGPDDKQAAKEVIKDYPELIHDRAYDLYKENFKTLQAIEELRVETEEVSSTVLAAYPNEVQSAMRYLLEMPDVLTLLNEHIDLTILVGEVYQKYPDWLLQKADSLQQELANQQAKEFESWKKTLEENPEAKEELKASAEEYAKEQGYDYDDLYYTGDDLYMNYEEEEPDEVIVRHQYYNYPYWYSYPYWYHYPRWRPLPWWHLWGLHYYPGGRAVVVNLPSYYLLDWYFDYPYHHYYYPHLTAHCVNHYYRYRDVSRSSVTVNVSRWQAHNRAVLTDDYLRSPNRQVARIKEFGKMETDRIDYNRKYPSRSVTQTEYLQRNPDKYREIKAVKRPVKATAPTRKSTTRQEKIWIREKEKVQTPPDKRTTRPKPNWDRKSIYKQPNSQREEIKREQQNIRKIDKARDYHRDRWTQPKPQQKIQRPTIKQRQPATRTAPRKQQPSKAPNQKGRN